MPTPIRRFGAAFALLALLLAACGGDGDNESASGDDAPGSTTGGSGNGDTSLNPDATLVFADPFQNDTIDPDKNDSGFPTRQLALVYDRLIGIDPDGTLVPQLATEWEFTSDTTLVLTLREGVTFQDGEEFNADAVVANFDRSMSLEEASSAVKTPAASIASVEASGPHEVTINLSTPRYSLPYDLAQNLGMMISPAALDGSLDLQAVGAGMFRLVDFKPGVSATYEAWDGYWDPDAVKVAGFEIQSIGNAQTRLNAVQSGQATMALIDENQVDAAEKADLTVTTQSNVSAWTIFVNLTRNELANPAVRQAISMSIDRQALVDSLAFGHGEPTVQMFPEDYYAYSSDVPLDRFAYDPDAAADLLADAGIEDLKLSFLVMNRPLDEQMAQALQRMLGDAGIEVELQVVEPARYSIFTDGDVDIYMGRWGGRADPADTLYSNAGETGFINPGGGTTPEFEAIMDELSSVGDEAERTELLQRASAEFAEQQLDIPLFLRESIFADNGCVVGFRPYLVGADEYRGVGISADC